MSDSKGTADQPWLDSEASPFIRIEGITKKFGDFTAVDNVDLEIYRGELFCLLGGSGCGKTTLLRMLAGFERPTQGSIYIDGVDMTSIPPYERPVNMMFQSYALFPHMTVENNVSYGLKRDGIDKDEIRSRVSDMLGMVEMSDYAQRKPHQLSGGQCQRVALARALVKQPKVLLLDEPLAALDKKLREQTQFELMNIQDKLGVTFIVVTHDQEEAMTLSTRIAVMDRGEFVQIGSPTQIYEFPENRMVADFIGSINLFEGDVSERNSDQVSVQCDDLDSEFTLDNKTDVKSGTRVWVALRPEKIRMSRANEEQSSSAKPKAGGVVQEIGYLGGLSTYRVKLDSGKVITVTLPNQVRARDSGHIADWDEPVSLYWDDSNAVLLFE